MKVKLIMTNKRDEVNEKVYDSKSNEKGVVNACELAYKLGMKKIQAWNLDTNELIFSRG